MFHTKLHYSWQISASCAESTRWICRIDPAGWQLTNSLFWLSFRRNGKLVGIVVLEVRELLEARMLAAIDGLGECAEFAGGY